MVLTDNCLWPSIFDDLLPKRLCAACLFTQAYSLAHTQLYFWFLSRSTKMGVTFYLGKYSVRKSNPNLVFKLVRSVMHNLWVWRQSRSSTWHSRRRCSIFLSTVDVYNIRLLLLDKNHPKIRLMPSFIVNCQLSATSTTFSTWLFWPHSIVSVQNKQHIRRLSATNRPLSLFRSEPLLPPVNRDNNT